MRYFLYILIAWFGILASTAHASEILLGAVVTVDRDHGRITLRVIDQSGASDTSKKAESIVITTSPDKIPNGLSKGDTIRVWGAYTEKGDITAFRADAIRMGGSGNSGNDPTGVRSRLGQGWGGGGQGSTGRGFGRK